MISSFIIHTFGENLTANLSGANLRNANLTNAKLAEVDLSQADLYEAKSLWGRSK